MTAEKSIFQTKDEKICKSELKREGEGGKEKWKIIILIINR